MAGLSSKLACRVKIIAYCAPQNVFASHIILFVRSHQTLAQFLHMVWFVTAVVTVCMEKKIRVMRMGDLLPASV